jgi:hypothetical protein
MGLRGTSKEDYAPAAHVYHCSRGVLAAAGDEAAGPFAVRQCSYPTPISSTPNTSTAFGGTMPGTPLSR